MTNAVGRRVALKGPKSAAGTVFLFVLLSLALNWFYLLGGFQADEFFFLNSFREDPLPYSRWLGLWSTEGLSSISDIWWFEGGDLGVFWRPVPSLILEGSVRLFGERAWPLNLFGIVTHGLVAGLLFLLVLRLTERRALALLAGLFFIVCEDHSMTVGWIATLTDLVCSLFVAIALVAHAAWLRGRTPALMAVTLAALVLALLSKESAVVAPVLLALMSLLLPHGREREHRARLWTFLGDPPSWAPALIVLAVYLATFAMLGFGGISSGIYVNPLLAPGRWLAQLATHLPIMWLAALSPVPPSLAMLIPSVIPLLAVAGAVLFALFVAGLWWLRRSALAWWAMATFILALVPQMSAGASERALYLAALGSSVLLAMLCVEIGPIRRRSSAGTQRAPFRARAAGWATILVVLVPGVLLSIGYPFAYVPSGKSLRENVLTAVTHVEDRQARLALLLNAPGIFYVFYPPTIVDFYVDREVDVRVLSALNGVVSVERSDERSFVIRTDRDGWLTNLFSKILRSARLPEPGTVFEKRRLTAEVLEMTAGGTDVAAVRFELDRTLDDPDLLLLQWDGATYRPIDLASLPVGERVVLADTSDLWASMW